MTALEIITKKRDGCKLTASEIDFFVQKYVADEIPDYQMAALLMAVTLRGMDFEEAADLTRIMLRSGEVLDLSDLPEFKVDKHSTGGVGDKVSLILAPLMASVGLVVPMISGRGLAHSGGTLDKLEAIPGFQIHLSGEEFRRQLSRLGVCMIGQTTQIAPADRKMYALRDVTGTIESIPLITASILSKKLAEGIQGLVLDVKTGVGAFMTHLEAARELAHSLIKTAELNGVRTVAMLSNMNQPLGNTVGNWLETHEAIETLRGSGPEDLRNMTLALGAQMMLLADSRQSQQMAMEKLQKQLDNGAALARFREMVQAQHGDVTVVDQPERYPKAKVVLPLVADRSGYISKVDAKKIGMAVVHLGGGRFVIQDQVDHQVGVVLHKKVADCVVPGDLLAEVHANDTGCLESAFPLIRNAFEIVPQPVAPEELIFETIRHTTV